MTDRYQATLAYLQRCEALSGVLNFQAFDYQHDGDIVQVVTQGSDSARNREFIDGSKECAFDLVVAFYKPQTVIPYDPAAGSGNASVQALLDVQSLIEWLDARNHAYDYPDFGDKKQVTRVWSLNSEPQLVWVDGEHYNPPLAKYTVTIRVEYMDYTYAI